MDNKEASGKDSQENKETATVLDLLALGKRSGLTFEEMNELRVRDLVGMVESYTGTKKEGPREATQEDIDAFYARIF